MKHSSEVAAQHSAIEHKHVYVLKPGWRFFMGALSLVLAVGSIAAMLYFGSGHEVNSRQGALAWVAGGAAFLLLSAYCLVWAIRARTVLRQDSIEVRGALLSRRMRTDQILGWRTIPQRDMPPAIVLFPRDTGVRKLNVSQALRLDDTFFEWLMSFDNLDEHDLASSEEEVLTNNDLGFTREERTEALGGAKRTARLFTFWAFATSAWGWFYPVPYRLVIAVLATTPLFALWMTFRSNGLYRLDEHKNDAHPNVAIPFMLPGFVLLLRGVLDLGFVGWSRTSLIAVAVGVVLSVFAAICDPSLRAKRATLAAMLFVSCAYGLGVTLESNALLDRSKTTMFSPVIIEKHTTRGRSTTYRFLLEPWGPVKGSEEVDVSRRLYTALKPGDHVCVSLRKGAFGVPWYTVDLCE